MIFKNIKHLENEVTTLRLMNNEMMKEIAELREELSKKTPPSTVEFSNRIAELEIKMSKLWGLLLEETRKGDHKLSKTGKRFGGQSRSIIQ